MKIKSLLFILLLWNSSLFSQENIEVLSVLPNDVIETSGLIVHNGKLITHNDSGNTPQLFEIDSTTFQITRIVTVENVENIDWEDLTQDEQYIYIGDFGNNVGVRTDLRILRINKEDYNQSDSVTAEVINFIYEDQADFENTGNSDWDAEALFIWNDQLIVLTKQWQSGGTDAYTIPKTPGEHIARKIDTYAINGLVTGATYNPLSDVLFLIGYSSTLGPFTTSFETLTTNTTIFTNQGVRTNLNIGLAQVESIAYADDNTYYFTSERFSRTTPAVTLESTLFRFDFTDMTEPEPEPEPEPQPEPEPEPQLELGANEIILYKGRLYDFMEYQSGIQAPIIKRSIFDMSGREVRYVLGNDIENNRIDLSTLQNGIYYLTFFYSDSKKTIPFYKD